MRILNANDYSRLHEEVLQEYTKAYPEEEVDRITCENQIEASRVVITIFNKEGRSRTFCLTPEQELGDLFKNTPILK